MCILLLRRMRSTEDAARISRSRKTPFHEKVLATQLSGQPATTAPTGERQGGQVEERKRKMGKKMGNGDGRWEGRRVKLERESEEEVQKGRKGVKWKWRKREREERLTEKGKKEEGRGEKMRRKEAGRKEILTTFFQNAELIDKILQISDVSNNNKISNYIAGARIQNLPGRIWVSLCLCARACVCVRLCEWNITYACTVSPFTYAYPSIWVRWHL